MNGKIISIILVALAVIAGSISAMVVTVKRADIARAKAEIAASKEDAAREKRKAKEKEDSAATNLVIAAALEADNLRRQERLNKEKQEADRIARDLASEQRKLAEAKADEAEELKLKADKEHQIELTKLKYAEVTNKTMLVNLRIAEEKTKLEAARVQAERIKKDREDSLNKAKELRKLDLDEWQRDLMDLQRDLEERERALAPEKTIADLAWVAQGEDSVLDDNGNVVRKPKTKYMAENDLTLPAPSRQLAKMMRLRGEAGTNRAATARAAVVDALEKLFEDALKADRPADAEFYQKSIRMMYPDWTSTKSITNVLSQIGKKVEKKKEDNGSK